MCRTPLKSKRLISAALAQLFVLLAASAFAWGPTGHRATGLIAEKYLDKKAKKEMLRILGGQSLAMAATWMDDVRSDSTYDYMADWHWVTIQDGQTYDQSEKIQRVTLSRLLSGLFLNSNQKNSARKKKPNISKFSSIWLVTSINPCTLEVEMTVEEMM